MAAPMALAALAAPCLLEELLLRFARAGLVHGHQRAERLPGELRPGLPAPGGFGEDHGDGNAAVPGGGATTLTRKTFSQGHREGVEGEA